jgi:hypothetical protein
MAENAESWAKPAVFVQKQWFCGLANDVYTLADGVYKPQTS